MENKCIVIAGFAGLGKTTLERKYKKVIDVESSYFKWLNDGLENLTAEQRKGLPNRKLNPNFPQNYINEIKKLMKSNRILLVYIGNEVRKKLEEENIEFMIALPTPDSKEILIERLRKRGNPPEFIQGFSERFDEIEEKYKNIKQKKIYVNKDEFLEDALKREHLLDEIELKNKK